jgi:GntR family transcriptional regulator/MocR family aminotransferase
MTKRAGGALLPTFEEGPETAEGPLYLRVYRRVRGAILEGALAPGARLPSTRTLAAELGVSRNTVELAFAQLDTEGFLVRRVGAGSFVADVRPRRPAPAPPRKVAVTLAGGSTDGGAAPRLSARGRVLAMEGAESVVIRSFTPCVPELDAFPYATWHRLLARRSRRSGRALLAEVDVGGYRPLREAIAAHLGTARGVRCDWRQVIVLASTNQALELAARLVLDAGDAAWIEEPGYLGARAALRGAGARLVPVPVDEQGIDVAAGEAREPAARLAYVTPSHQYPLGVTLSLARRLALLGWAARAGAWIFEDDYDSELRYTGRPLAAVQGLDADGRVIYAGTFNKPLFPSLRLSYVVVPPALVDPFSAARAQVDGCAPALSQAVLADFVADGHFGAYLRRMRAVYAERRMTLLDAVELETGGRLRLGPSDTGLHVAAFLPPGAADARVSEAAAARGLDAPPLSRYHVEPAAAPGLVLSYATLPPDAIRRGVRTLREVLEEMG